MPGSGLNFNVRLRTDSKPEQLLKELILSPLIYIRLLGILFSIIVFGCISDKVLVPVPGVAVETCNYNNNFSACTFPIAVGVVGFFLCIAFFLKDVLYIVTDFSDSPVVVKVLLLLDAVVNGFWALMWFVSFCLTADQLRVAHSTGYPILDQNCANTGVAFSFFSMLVWGAIVGVNVFMFVRLAMGKSPLPGAGGRSGYSSVPESGYQGNNESDDGDQHKSQYTPPEY